MMKKITYLIMFLLMLSTGYTQTTSHWGRTFKNAAGVVRSRLNIDLYTAGGAKVYDLAESSSLPGYYYFDTIATGDYDVYINGVKTYSNVWIGTKKLTSMEQYFSSDGRIITGTGVPDSSIALYKFTTAAYNFIGSGGSVTNNPDDRTIINAGGSTLGVNESWLDTTGTLWKLYGDADSAGTKKVGVYQHALNDDIIYGQDYGMVGDGATDNAANLQAAVNSFSYPYYGTILLGDGIFVFSSTVNLKGVGLRLVGNGKSKTVLLFNNSTPDAVFMSMGQTTDYIREASFENMKIINGSDVSTYHKSGKCFDMSTSSGNVRFNKFENLEIYGFKWVVWIEGTTGHDGTVMENCCFKHNTNIWYSENAQAVNNFITDCNFEQNDSTLFHIKKGGHFIFRGGSWINKGKTLHLDSDVEGIGIGSGNSTFAFYGVKFEMRENDPTLVDTPKVVYMDKPQHANVSFFSCSNFGSSNNAKTYYAISGQTTLEFNNSYMVGNIEATSTASTAAYPDNALIIIKDSKYNGNVIDKDARLYPRIIKNTDFQMDHYVLEAGNNRQYNSESCVSRYIAYQSFTTSPYSFSYIFPVDVAITGVRVLRKYSGCGDITVTLFANSAKTDTIKTMIVPYRTGSDNYYYEPLTSGACVSMADTIYVDITCASAGGNMLKIDVYY